MHLLSLRSATWNEIDVSPVKALARATAAATARAGAIPAREKAHGTGKTDEPRIPSVNESSTGRKRFLVVSVSGMCGMRQLYPASTKVPLSFDVSHTSSISQMCKNLLRIVKRDDDI